MAELKTPRWRVAALAATALALLAGYLIIRESPDGERPSPLTRYLGFQPPGTGLGLTASTGSDTGIARQEAIATCMAEQGYDYTPTTPSEPGVSPVPDPLTREYAEIYGFGITTIAFRSDQVGQHLRGYPEPVAHASDPNLDTLADLPAEERPDYVEALTGNRIEPDTPITADLLAERPDPGGCQGEHPSTAAAQTAFLARFGDDIQTLRDEILTDPDLTDFEASIADCVAEQGHTHLAANDRYQHWADQLESLHQAVQALPAGDGETATLPQLNAQAKAELLTIQAEERALATATYDCGGDPGAYNATLRPITERHEQDFITAHEADLDTFLAEQWP